MSMDDPPQEATEAAVAELLRLTFLWIRTLSARLVEDQSTEALIKRHAQIHELADICHNLPGLLDPGRRHNLAAGLRYEWRTSSQRKRDWMTACWDRADYDYGWLSEPESEQSAADSDSGASGG
ncbi:hypothetical protein OG992_29070 [Micromonospora sp. NBC_00362]|uniref:hypothetical protein n=1 Tax=Micromonospora sp. NBC_00362 TaxID=2975975 RepID=UPI002255CE6F|nr:hypothetical protein [Micromonospora sp. NBC_00362]MCX5121237.1 hypothetical protein [Micromonospora sp. NBC_00362]